jgi:hypothetical protein
LSRDVSEDIALNSGDRLTPTVLRPCQARWSLRLKKRFGAKSCSSASTSREARARSSVNQVSRPSLQSPSAQSSTLSPGRGKNCAQSLVSGPRPWWSFSFAGKLGFDRAPLRRYDGLPSTAWGRCSRCASASFQRHLRGHDIGPVQSRLCPMHLRDDRGTRALIEPPARPLGVGIERAYGFGNYRIIVSHCGDERRQAQVEERPIPSDWRDRATPAPCPSKWSSRRYVSHPSLIGGIPSLPRGNSPRFPEHPTHPPSHTPRSRLSLVALLPNPTGKNVWRSWRFYAGLADLFLTFITI